MNYLSEDYTVLDVETTNKKYGSAQEKDNSLLMAVWTNGNAQGYRIGNEYKFSDMVQQCEDHEFIVAHNAKFELKWLSRMGGDLSKISVWDTMIAEYVIHGNERVPLDLGSVATRYGFPGKEPYIDLCMKNGVCPSVLPQKLVLQRCNYDVWVTKEIFLKQREILRDTGKLGVMMTRCILTPVLADIESNGMFLDSARVEEAYHIAVKEYEEVTTQLDELTGGINYNSPKQMAEYLYDVLKFKQLTKRGKVQTTASGKPMTNAATLAALNPTNKTQRKFCELIGKRSHYNAALTKALNKFKECCDNNDLLYAQFNQCVTATHRLSSSGTDYGVQFQNLARAHKPMFTARNDGWLMGEIDGAQLEFRIAAFVGNDARATEDIRNGVDVHSFTAKTITDAGQDTNRQEAKAHTFKPLFGGTSGTPAEVAYYEAFKKKYAGIAATQQSWIDEVLRNKKLRTCTGLEFFWPTTKMQRSGFVTNSQNICNYPVQSLATADIIPIAVYYFWLELRKRNLRSFIVNTIHDSVILEVHPEEIEIIKEISVDAFTHKVYNYLDEVYNLDFNVPLGVGIKFAKHWSEGEEISITVERDI